MVSSLSLYVHKISQSVDCEMCHGLGIVESIGDRRVFCECCKDAACIEHLEPKDGDVLVFNIPVGHMPVSKVREYIGAIASEMTKRLGDGHGVDLLFCPVHADGNGPSVVLCPDNTWRQWPLA